MYRTDFSSALAVIFNLGLQRTVEATMGNWFVDYFQNDYEKQASKIQSSTYT